MNEYIAIYQLHTKFVNQRTDIPEDARQVVYYTLAVGHHVGVLDCFSSAAEIPLDEFKTWLSQLPEGPGRSKLEGVLRFSEIEINHGHLNLLAPLVIGNGLEPKNNPDWLATLAQCLQAMAREPAIYLMLRKHA